eukprot:Em0013g1082a
MVPPNNQCLNALLKLTCSKCQKSIPMLCRNVCGAVAKGCYAPYAAVLNPQFNILWNVSSQLAQALVSALSDLFMQQGKIRKALIDGLMTGCAITVPSNVTIIPPQGLGNQFMKKVQMLLNTGLLSNDPTDGPVLCNSSSMTARANCWNGTILVANDIPQFMVNSIKGQAQNPVSPFDETQLAQQVQSIGAPVSSFLSSPDITVAISGAAITIPQDQTNPTSATTSDGSVGARAVSLSLLFLLFALASMLSL